MGKAEQKKGRRAEIELANLLNEYGIPAQPGNPMSYGKTPDIVGVAGCHVETKRHERMNLYAWLKQAQEDSQKFGGLPVVMHRANRHGWIASMPIESWIELYKKGLDDNEIEDI